MRKERDYIGWGLDSHRLDLVRVTVSGKKIRVRQMQQVDLPQVIGEDTLRRQQTSEGEGGGSSDPDDIFGISESGRAESPTSTSTDVPEPGDLNEIDLDDLEGGEEIDLDDLESDPDLDMVEEADQADTNHQRVYEALLNIIGHQKAYIGLNIPSGSAHLNMESENRYGEMKSRQLREIVEGQVQSIHGTADPESYSFDVDPDGRLWIASLEGEPMSLELFNQIIEHSGRKKLVVREILPDEMALIGLYRINYSDEPEKVTALVQFREHRTRIIFMRGHRILQISQIINEGVADRNVLNTVFSKILFQLDTGEISSLERIILCDNRLGDKSVNFFKENFPGVDIEPFTLERYHFDLEIEAEEEVGRVTTAMALAVAATGSFDRHFPSLSIIPAYVIDRQKFFRLQWHGALLLILIGLSPIYLNHIYQQNLQQISALQSEEQQLEMMIGNLTEPVAEIERMEEELAAHREQLELMHELTEGTVRWTATLDHLHEGLDRIGGIWITSFNFGGDGLQLDGYSLTEARIPQLARHFGRATLNQVMEDEIRERPVYRFRMQVDEALHDPSLYTPQQSREIPEFLDSF